MRVYNLIFMAMIMFSGPVFAGEQVMVYKSAASRWLIFGSCSLKVIVQGEGENSEIYFQTSESRTKFHGVWPKFAGEVQMAIPPNESEILSVRFVETVRGLEPFSYIYYNTGAKARSRLIDSKRCEGLVRVE